MPDALESLQKALRRLPGLGARSAERIALHLLVEKPDDLPVLQEALRAAASTARRCDRCGNLAVHALCPLCSDPARDPAQVCVVERVPDLLAIERSGAWRGIYHVLHGRLSPLHDIGPAQLNLETLTRRLAAGEIRELTLALPNDVEAEATCQYILRELPLQTVRVARIGFGLPSGGAMVYADAVTVRAALEARRDVAR